MAADSGAFCDAVCFGRGTGFQMEKERLTGCVDEWKTDEMRARVCEQRWLWSPRVEGEGWSRASEDGR